MTRQMHNKIKNNQMHLLHRATTLHQLKVIRLLPRAINLTLKAIRLPPRAINLTQRVISQTLRVIRLLPQRVTRLLPQREIIQLRQIVTPKREINPQTRLTPPNLLPQQVKKVLSLKGTVQGPNQAGTSLSQINSWFFFWGTFQKWFYYLQFVDVQHFQIKRWIFAMNDTIKANLSTNQQL